MIDVKKFQEMYEEIDKKVQEIRVLPMLNTQEQNYTGFEIEDDEIRIMSEYYTSGCGDDYSSLYIPLDEIGNSVEWFKEKFQKEIDENTRKIAEIKEQKRKEVEASHIKYEADKLKKELAIYRKIKKQLENKSK